MPTQEMTVASDATLEAVRDFLREMQKADSTRAHLRPRPQTPPVVELALQHLIEQHKWEPTDDVNTVTRGIFKFDRRQEETRMRLAEDLIRRVDPGPYEDPSYLALLAFQAASIEMAFENLAGGPDPQRWSQFLLGTSHSNVVDSFAQTFHGDRHVVIVMTSALVDFVYQAAKALVAAQDPHLSHVSGSTLSSTTDPASIEKFIQNDPEPINRLYRTFEAYFYRGYPRAFVNEPVKAEHHPVLGSLIGLAERWAIAHEYGHGFARDRLDRFSRAPNPAWAQEFFADQNATVLTVLSSVLLDSMPPESALASGIFVLACLDLLRRAAAVVRTGKDPGPEDDPTHPPNKQRAEFVVDTFYEFFDAVYDDRGRLRDLIVVRNKSNRLPVSDHVRRQISGSFDFAKGLFVIWKPVKQLLLQDHANQRPLHDMWTPE